MDREDARFVAGALRSLISGDEADLDRLAASSLLRLSACVGTIERLNRPAPGEKAGGWPPAAAASRALQAIIQGGAAKALDLPAAIAEDLARFADMCETTAAETRPANREERRRNASVNDKRGRTLGKLIGLGRPELVKVH
jgi:hypothetical protein